ncbi:MAG TPA: excinuclease ABC subunit B, partial [Marinilabiliales bacterium]|nr:excinuclease ABC subunit B [Marinilabiliales bacterium]
DRLRHAATHALLTRKDVIIVASVSCIYGIGSPELYRSQNFMLEVGKEIKRDHFLSHLIAQQYSRNDFEIKRGTFRLKGDILEIFPAYSTNPIKIEFFGDKIERISEIDWITGLKIKDFESYEVFPATHFVIPDNLQRYATAKIKKDLDERVKFFKKKNKLLEAQRIEERTNYDLEMIETTGYCKGIENYSRYFDGRNPGTRPFCLLDYFPNDFITIIDESHVTLPQIRAMYGGDRSRKETLVEYGFRLPAAMDNRPLKFDEFDGLTGQTIYVSATPADYELEKCGGVIVEQVIRPTGLLDPIIDVRPSLNQIDDLIKEIHLRIDKEERVLVTTLTKRMAEELNKYLGKLNIRSNYIHSDVDTLDRVEIMENLRKGVFDVLVGVNLLREGLDLPEVSLVAILDADKEGFLRSERSLTQTAGRAARNLNGKVIMYADKMTGSMQRTIDETNRRRIKQLKYNSDNDITPQSITKAQRSMVSKDLEQSTQPRAYSGVDHTDIAADPVIAYMSKEALLKTIDKTKKLMEQAAGKLDFIEAARLRDEMFELQRLLEKK